MSLTDLFFLGMGDWPSLRGLPGPRFCGGCRSGISDAGTDDSDNPPSDGDTILASLLTSLGAMAAPEFSSSAASSEKLSAGWDKNGLTSSLGRLSV